jgi:protein-L-isoaspartate(D-aspartate) O-methyltransferase
MFIPVGTYNQEIIQVDKDRDGKVTQKSLFGVRVSRSMLEGEA